MSDNARRKPAAKQPISRHPLFPAIVALWFGALFGLGSIMVRPELIERAVLALHIDSVIPMAAPPLGTTMRILLALTMTGIGGVLGALLGRRIASPPAEHHERRRKAKPVDVERRTVKASRSFSGPRDAELEGDGEANPGNRRRSLALHEEPVVHEARQHAPLPGDGPQILNLSELDFAEVAVDEPVVGARFMAPAWADDDDIDAADTVGILEPTPPPAAQVFVAEELEPQAPVAAVWPDEEPPISDRRDPVVTAAPFSTRMPGAKSLFETYSSAIGSSAIGNSQQEFAQVQTEVSFAPTFQPVAADSCVPAEEVIAEAETEPASALPEDPETPCDAEPTLADATAAERIASAELGQLSPVELLERLAIAMEQRRLEASIQRPAAAAALEPLVELVAVTPEPLPFAAPTFQPEPEVETLGAEQYEQVEPETIAPPPFAHLPAALRPVSLDDDEDDALPGYIPPRHIGANFAAMQPATLTAADDIDAGEGDDAEDETLEEGYSSLLNLSLPAGARQPSVRIEEPEPEEIQPVVIFPGEAAATPQALPTDLDSRRFDAPSFPATAPGMARQDPEETERALRAALATLQRMSGAA